LHGVKIHLKAESFMKKEPRTKMPRTKEIPNYKLQRLHDQGGPL